jgi:hypothetical protein
MTLGKIRIGLCLTLAALSGCGKPPESGAPAAADSHVDSHASAAGASEGVTLKPEDIEHMGIASSAAIAMSRAPEASGFGLVAAHETIAQAVSELVTAAATQRQSQAALARVRRLAGTPGALPADARESAERQATVDEAASLLARERLTATFGQKPPWGHRTDSPLLRAIASGETQLVRVTFPLGALDGDAVPSSLRLGHIDDLASGRSWTTSTVWSAPADASLPGSSFFALLAHTTAREGERVVAWASVGERQNGAWVPASAVVIADNKYWCYVELKAGTFVRRPLDTSIPVDAGYFVTAGILPGEQVVTSAAGQLLARETNPATGSD